MSFLNGAAEQLATASILGKPSSQASVVFAGPSRFAQLSDGERTVVPLGMMASIMTQDSRTNITQEVIGMADQIGYGYQKGRKIGAITGLVLFMEDAIKLDPNASSESVWSHFLKNLYGSLRKSHPALVSPFYKTSAGDDENFFEPIAFDDSDRWRNFSSMFFSIPIGLYKWERSEGGKVLEATYYENVRLEGGMNTQIQVGQMGPQFEQFGFVYSRAVPVDPSDYQNLTGQIGSTTPGETATSVADFTAQLKLYLGI
jgi:hypothetical protein